MQNISQRNKNSNRHSVQWLPSGDHEVESWGLVENLKLSAEGCLTLIHKLFIRELVAGTQDLANGSLAPNLTFLN